MQQTSCLRRVPRASAQRARLGSSDQNCTKGNRANSKASLLPSIRLRQSQASCRLAHIEHLCHHAWCHWLANRLLHLRRNQVPAKHQHKLAHVQGNAYMFSTPSTSRTSLTNWSSRRPQAALVGALRTPARLTAGVR